MNCRSCSKEFTPSDPARLSRYCSAECRAKSESRRAIENYRRRASALRYTCKQCGVVYTPKCANRNQFCGRECARIAMGFDLAKPSQNRPFCKVYYPACGQCGKTFVSNLKTVRLCSELCREADCVKTRNCKACGTEFIGKQAKVFCSRACMRATGKPKRRVYQKVRRQKRRACGMDDRGKHRKRARRYGVEYESISLAKVLERDGWLCGLHKVKAINAEHHIDVR